jgi:16S rRNA (cytidine1402-2'-O)-methyltransferase
MLYILSSPIGNLEDLSDRAKRILKDVDLIIAENPPYSKRLTDHLGLSGKRFLQFADHNEEKVLPKILEELKANDAILISDAGTPGISDPGFRLIRAVIQEGLNLTPIPGPNAAVTALCASGLPTDRFIFLGFVPKTEIKLIRELEKAKDLEATVVFYESPHRIIKTVVYISKTWPEANVVIARELTKLHEEFIRGKATEVLSNLESRSSIKGEITVVLSFK